jgi:cell division protein FtsW
MRFISITGAMGVVSALVLAGRSAERWSRITCFMNPWRDPSGDCFQLVQGYYALGTGGLFGTGLGNSRARWFFLPNAHTDFIFAIIGEETGLVGGLVVIALFMLLAITGWMIANRANDAFGRMVAVGITAWLTFQAVVNIGGVLGVLPITGVTLPFVSYGGTSLAISMTAVGVLVNIASSSVSSGRTTARA